MNETTRTLLLKTRKGATAAFGPKQWQEVLETLGARVQVEKTRNTVTKFVVQVPDTGDIHGIQGFTLVIEKEPNYRRITQDVFRKKAAAELARKGQLDMHVDDLNIDTSVEPVVGDLHSAA